MNKYFDNSSSKVVLFLINIFLMLFFSCKQEKKVIYAERRDIIESVYSSLLVEPDSLYQAFSSVSGICDTYFVDEGDLVNIGDPIVQIRNNTPKLNEENAKLLLDVARENYKGSSAVLSDLKKEINAEKPSVRVAFGIFKNQIPKLYKTEIKGEWQSRKEHTIKIKDVLSMKDLLEQTGNKKKWS